MPVIRLRAMLAKPNRDTLIRVLLGVVLLGAAGTKLYALDSTFLGQPGWATSPALVLATVLWEAILGAWLLTGTHRVVVWLATTVTFFIFAIVSFNSGWAGQEDCGCLGAVRASPWLAFSIDAIALLLLGLTRPHWDRVEMRGSLLAGSLWLAAIVAIFALMGVGASWIYGSLDVAVARLRNQQVSVRPSFVDLGSVKAGETIQATVAIYNWSDQPVRLIGGTSDCSCVTTADLPLTIGPRESAGVHVSFNVPSASNGRMVRVVSFWSDHQNAPVVWFKLGCQIE